MEFCCTIHQKIQKKEYQAILQALDHRVQGILMLPVIGTKRRTVELLKKAEEDGIHVVLIDRNVPDGEFAAVFVDNRKTIYDGISLFLKAWHEKIGIITCPEVLRDGMTRLDGYVACLADVGIVLRKEYIYQGDFSQESGYQACLYFRTLPDPPTAVLATCSSETLGCIRYLNENGLTPGLDVGLIGFDDISTLNTIGYPVTMLDCPMRSMGEVAYEMLNDRMNGRTDEKKCKRVLMESRILIRGSERRGGRNYAGYGVK